MPAKRRHLTSTALLLTYWDSITLPTRIRLRCTSKPHMRSLSHHTNLPTSRPPTKVMRQFHSNMTGLQWTTLSPKSRCRNNHHWSGSPTSLMSTTSHSLSPNLPARSEWSYERGTYICILISRSFRYHVTLNAPTAMIKHPDEIPVTYLNKGQAYTISLVDTAPQQTSSNPVKYRTFIRISFEDEQQRQRPAACWQLWKEGRGTNEAHQRGGRLQAVEFVDPTQVGGGEVQGRPKVELENASFDGFSVTWTPVHNAVPECSLAVRFNFLSTDFSHSKGVKGIPVRLCAKTELLTTTPESPEDRPNAELCYCKVKLFRDHGAERKLSNDVAHVKKTIDKQKQQIAQVESGMKDFGKRKRSGSISKTASSRPGKVPKHKRTWSMSSASSNSGTRPPAEEDLHMKLASLQDMFSSTRPVSVLYLKGGEPDDPDLNPVQLTGTPQDLAKIDTNVDATMWERQSPQTGAASSLVSPTPSTLSLQSERRRGSTFQQPTPFSRMSSNEWRNTPQTATGDLKPHGGITAGSDVPTKVQRPYGDDHALSGWIEALGVDQTYQPPPEPMLKPGM
jgi:hypothetical protein